MIQWIKTLNTKPTTTLVLNYPSAFTLDVYNCSWMNYMPSNNLDYDAMVYALSLTEITLRCDYSGVIQAQGYFFACFGV